MTVPELADPQSVVARIIAELEANPAARELLLRALLTEEFLQLPARVARIEEEILPRIEGDIKALQGDVKALQGDVKALQGDMKTAQGDINTMKVDIGKIKGTELEATFAHRATSILNREFGFTRIRVMHGRAGAFLQYAGEFIERVADAMESGLIPDEQWQRVFDTDVILQCRRPGETQPTWVAVEVAARIDQDDINRVLRSVQALETLFGEVALPVVSGERIDPPDVARARQLGVTYIELLLA